MCYCAFYNIIHFIQFLSRCCVRTILPLKQLNVIITLDFVCFQCSKCAGDGQFVGSFWCNSLNALLKAAYYEVISIYTDISKAFSCCCCCCCCYCCCAKHGTHTVYNRHLSGLLSIATCWTTLCRTFARTIAGFLACLFSCYILYFLYDLIINSMRIFLP